MDNSSSHCAGAPPSQPSITDPGILALLGPDVRSFPFLEDAFVHAIKLRLEQERSKQCFYQVELASRNLAIMQSALQLNIPPPMIPSLCVSSHDHNSLDELAANQALKNRPMPPFPQSLPGNSDTTPASTDVASRNHPARLSGLSMSLDAPISYRFGGQSQNQGQLQSQLQSQNQLQSQLQSQNQLQSQGQNQNQNQLQSLTAPSIPTQVMHPAQLTLAPPIPTVPSLMAQFAFSGNRPLSPSKLGAAAVANLALPTAPHWPLTIRGHHRHLSMPAVRESGFSKLAKLLPTLALAKSHKAHSDENVTAHDTSNTPDVASRRNMHSSQPRQDPDPAISHRRTHSAQPHRESHVFQFEHWKPLPSSRATSPSRPSRHHQSSGPIHKRARSFSSDLARALADLSIKAKSRAIEKENDRRIQYEHNPLQKHPSQESNADDTIDGDQGHPSLAPPVVLRREQNLNGSSTPLPGKSPTVVSIPRIQCQTGQSNNVGRYPRDILSPYSK